MLNFKCALTKEDYVKEYLLIKKKYFFSSVNYGLIDIPILLIA